MWAGDVPTKADTPQGKNGQEVKRGEFIGNALPRTQPRTLHSLKEDERRDNRGQGSFQLTQKSRILNGHCFARELLVAFYLLALWRVLSTHMGGVVTYVFLSSIGNVDALASSIAGTSGPATVAVLSPDPV